MARVWIVFDVVSSEVMGVFDSKDAAMMAMRPGERAVPFDMNVRLPDGKITWIDGEFDLTENGEFVANGQ